MDKFIEFNGSIFNIRHIIAVSKCTRDLCLQYGPQYGIVLHVTGDIEKQYFDNEDARNAVFNQLSNQLLNM